MQLSASTKINDLLSTHPFLEDFLVQYDPHFRLLKNKLTRATVGRFATVGAAARIASVDLDALLRDLASAIEKETKARPEVTHEGGLSRQERIAMLGHIIAELHDGGDVTTARQHFARAVGDVDAGEIAAMEEEMIRGGLPVAEVQRLCDVHVGTFKDALDKKTELSPTAGHPVHTYMADNRILAKLAEQLADIARKLGADESNGSMTGELLPVARAALANYDGLDNHYKRKENQLFPLLERHGITGPSQVMWGVHDQIRAQWKKARETVDAADVKAFVAEASALGRNLVEMVYKEEKILFPMAMEKLSAEEWAEDKRGEDELGYLLAKPAIPLKVAFPKVPPPAPAHQAVAPTGDAAAQLFNLGTGALSLEVVDLLLRHLPLDLSFVDENDVVRYYSEGKERIFPRTPAAIGRTVQNCHPPKSVATVNHILDSFRAGSKDVAEFWIEMGGRFIHIRYFAVRDRANVYKGCLEVTQDVSAIRALTGQRRLLDWEN
jgi:DUF438 domain-containing protein